MFEQIGSWVLWSVAWFWVVIFLLRTYGNIYRQDEVLSHVAIAATAALFFLAARM